MPEFPQHEEVLAKLIAWGNAHPAIRAMILTSSLARPGGPVDLLSDFDLILAVSDPAQFVRNGPWLNHYGQPMVRWGDSSELLGETTHFHGVIYEDYAKIDYTIWPAALLERIALEETLPEELDEGYRILLDKEGSTARWKKPTHRAFIPAKPTEAEFLAFIEEFWWSASYVAKSLWRDEMVFAHWLLEQEIKIELLRRLLEWRIEMDHDWSLRPGVNGRGLKTHLPLKIWSDFADTYVGMEREENWDALYRSVHLFRRVAIEVADTLGFTYPQALDDRMRSYLNALRELPS